MAFRGVVTMMMSLIWGLAMVGIVFKPFFTAPALSLPESQHAFFVVLKELMPCRRSRSHKRGSTRLFLRWVGSSTHPNLCVQSQIQRAAYSSTANFGETRQTTFLRLSGGEAPIHFWSFTNTGNLTNYDLLAPFSKENYGCTDIEVIYGCNGLIWVGQSSKEAPGRSSFDADTARVDEAHDRFSYVQRAVRELICRVANSVRVLAALGMVVDPHNIIDVCQHSTFLGLQPKDMMISSFLNHLVRERGLVWQFI